MDYTFSIGTHDPRALVADDDVGAVSQAGALMRAEHADMLRTRPEVVVVLLGPHGLVTRPSERLDEFMARGPAGSPPSAGTLQPGDTNAPDCNLD